MAPKFTDLVAHVLSRIDDRARLENQPSFDKKQPRQAFSLHNNLLVLVYYCIFDENFYVIDLPSCFSLFHQQSIRSNEYSEENVNEVEEDTYEENKYDKLVTENLSTFVRMIAFPNKQQQILQHTLKHNTMLEIGVNQQQDSSEIEFFIHFENSVFVAKFDTFRIRDEGQDSAKIPANLKKLRLEQKENEESEPLIVIKVKWHPFSKNHVAALTLMNFSLFNLSKNTENQDLVSEFEIKFFNSNMELETHHDEICGFCFGGNKRWEKFTVFFFTASKRVFAYCPLIPLRSPLPKSLFSDLTDTNNARKNKRIEKYLKSLAFFEFENTENQQDNQMFAAVKETTATRAIFDKYFEKGQYFLPIVISESKKDESEFDKIVDVCEISKSSSSFFMIDKRGNGKSLIWLDSESEQTIVPNFAQLTKCPTHKKSSSFVGIKGNLKSAPEKVSTEWNHAELIVLDEIQLNFPPSSETSNPCLLNFNQNQIIVCSFFGIFSILFQKLKFIEQQNNNIPKNWASQLPETLCQHLVDTSAEDEISPLGLFWCKIDNLALKSIIQLNEAPENNENLFLQDTEFFCGDEFVSSFVRCRSDNVLHFAKKYAQPVPLKDVEPENEQIRQHSTFYDKNLAKIQELLSQSSANLALFVFPEENSSRGPENLPLAEYLQRVFAPIFPFQQKIEEDVKFFKEWNLFLNQKFEQLVKNMMRLNEMCENAKKSKQKLEEMLTHQIEQQKRNLEILFKRIHELRNFEIEEERLKENKALDKLDAYIKQAMQTISEIQEKSKRIEEFVSNFEIGRRKNFEILDSQKTKLVERINEIKKIAERITKIPQLVEQEEEKNEDEKVEEEDDDEEENW